MKLLRPLTSKHHHTQQQLREVAAATCLSHPVIRSLCHSRSCRTGNNTHSLQSTAQHINIKLKQRSPKLTCWAMAAASVARISSSHEISCRGLKLSLPAWRWETCLSPLQPTGSLEEDLEPRPRHAQPSQRSQQALLLLIHFSQINSNDKQKPNLFERGMTFFRRATTIPPIFKLLSLSPTWCL